MYQQEPTLGKINTEDMKPKSFEMLVFSTLKCQNLSLEFPRKVKCNILPNEPLVHCCCSLLGLIQILLNNHKFHKCETSAQNCSVLFTNQHVSFLKKNPRVFHETFPVLFQNYSKLWQMILEEQNL